MHPFFQFSAFVFSACLCLTSAASSREMIMGPVVAEVIKVRDGDSVDVLARVWPGHVIKVSVRLRGIDAPEIRGRCAYEKDKAQLAKQRLQELLSSGELQLTQISGGKYFGRVLAVVKTEDGQDVQNILLAEKLARPYRGRKRNSWCVEDAADNS